MAAVAHKQITQERATSQATRVAHSNEFGSTDVDLSVCLRWLQAACYETGWGPEKLAIHMERDKSYVSRVLSGEKPLGMAFILSLPGDVQSNFAETYARHWGWSLVRPVSPDVAVQNLVSGLIGMLAPIMAASVAASGLPHGPLRMAKASGE